MIEPADAGGFSLVKFEILGSAHYTIKNPTVFDMSEISKLSILGGMGDDGGN